MLGRLGEQFFRWLGEKPFEAYASHYLEELSHTLSQYPHFVDLFPYESFDEKHQVFINTDSLGFVLETPPLVGASEEMQKEIDGLFQHSLPEESSLQVILWADPYIEAWLNHWQSKRIPLMQSLAKRRVAYLKQRALASKGSPYCLRNFRCFLAYAQKRQSLNPVVLEGLSQLQNQLKTSLEMLGLPTLVWGPEELINTLSQILSLNLTQLNPFHRRWDKTRKLSSQLQNPETNVVVNPKDLSLNLGKTTVRTYRVAQSPSLWSLHAMGQLIGDEERDSGQLPCPFILHYGLTIPKQTAPKTKVLAKASYVERQANSPLGKFLPSICEEAEELKFVRQMLGKGERIVQSQLTVILFSEENQLPFAEQILFNLYRSQEWQLQANHLLHLPIFLAAFPMMWSEDRVKSLLYFKKLKTTLSTEAANLLPLQGEWRGTLTPGMVLAGRRGQLMSWYPFDNNAGNYNVCVVGRSGSGKSVFMQELMTTTLGLGGKVFVLDVGRSFEKTCFLLNGQFIEFKTKTELCLNPFTSLPVGDLEAVQDGLSMLKPVLMRMAAPTRGADDMEAALLEQAMLETWKTFKNQSTVSHIAQFLLNHEDKKAQDLGTMLFPYTEQGVYGKFFQGPANVNLENNLVVIELEELKERKDLQAVIVQMMIINLTNRMFLGGRETPFHIVFDEAWDLLRGAQTGVFIETLARRLRKYNGSLVVGTQSINDFFVNAGAQAAFDNSDWMCLLSQKAESIEQLKKTSRISLTPLMEAQLKSVKTKQGHYAEVMIYGSQGYAIGRLLLDPYSELLYSTKAKDYASVRLLQEQGLSLEQALEEILKTRETS